MGYIIAGIISFIFLIWYVYYNITNKDKALEFRNKIKEQNKPKINKNGLIMCPKCNSTQITMMKRGWRFTTGFIGSGKNERVCMHCKHRF